jgi:Zn-dependent protease
MNDSTPQWPPRQPEAESLPGSGSSYAPEGPAWAPVPAPVPGMPAPLPRRRTWRSSAAINVLLFVLTFATTTFTGALHAGVDPLADRWNFLAGLPFSCTLLLILMCHEFGHYSLARYHGVPATLPYFIPAPPILVGTFGAFIRMRGMPRSRRALFDVGAAGPWAGLIVAIPAVMLGLHLSEVRPLSQGALGGITLGNSLLFNWLSQLVLGVDADSATIVLHPVALAGWFGLFVTFLNLLPVGQLDGGHVVYALFGRRHAWVAWPFFAAILWMSSLGWTGWLVFAGLLYGVVGVKHPDTIDSSTPLDPARRLAAWATIGVFALTFMAVPLQVVPGPDEPSAAQQQLERHRRSHRPERSMDIHFAPQRNLPLHDVRRAADEGRALRAGGRPALPARAESPT